MRVVSSPEGTERTSTSPPTAHTHTPSRTIVANAPPLLTSLRAVGRARVKCRVSTEEAVTAAGSADSLRGPARPKEKERQIYRLADLRRAVTQL